MFWLFWVTSQLWVHVLFLISETWILRFLLSCIDHRDPCTTSWEVTQQTARIMSIMVMKKSSNGVRSISMWSWQQFCITSRCQYSLALLKVKPVRDLELQPNNFIDMFINLPGWMHILPELSRSLWARVKRIVVPQSINWHVIRLIRKTDFFPGRAINLGRNTCFYMNHWKDNRFAKQTVWTYPSQM